MRRLAYVACAVLLVAGCGDGNNPNGGGNDLATSGDGPVNPNPDGGGQDGPPASCATNCTLGATSCDGDGVRTCTQSGECTDWSTAVPCSGALVCSGGVCVGSCTDQCNLGDTYCSQNGFRTCVQAGACTDWSTAVTACTNNTVCSGGACATTCTDRCASGAKQCSGSGVQSCEKKASGCLDWSDPVACAGGTFCSGGACSSSCSNLCNAGDVRCMGNDSTQTCAKQASGCTDWSPAQICASGNCSSNMCMPCVETSVRCGSTGNVETCTGGTWVQTAGCAFGCASGACTNMVTCTPGNYHCNGNAVEICNSSGTAWLYNATCAVSCSSGLCTGACTPNAKRCNGNKVEQCDATGTTWNATSTCSTACDAATSTCALAMLDVPSSMSLDGEIAVAGPVTVHSGATLTTPTGNLTIRATSITIELGGSIVASPTGQSPGGVGPNGPYAYGYGGGGGGYGANGTGSSAGAGSVWGSSVDANVAPGSMGGTGSSYSGSTGGNPGHGGGMLRLIANTITIAGQVTANGENGSPGTGTYGGGGGGGSGGGILIAADQITISGAVTAGGGGGGGVVGAGAAIGGTGGGGRVKILGGATRSVTGTITGTQTAGLLPPLQITSSTHPDPTLIYNDNFPVIALSWNQAFPSRQGYYQRVDTSVINVPTPANGQFVASEILSLLPSAVVAGSNYFHISPIDSTSTVGTIENNFRIQVNTTPPGITSSSHPSQTTWSTNSNVFYAWTFPVADNNLKGAYYVLDHYGSTVPTASDTFLPITQKQLLRSGLADGIWGFHVVSVDTRGYLTKQAGHYQVRLGADPGSGGILGHVVDNNSANVANAQVAINRGLFAGQTTNTMGNYNFGSIPAGVWEVTVTAAGLKPSTQMVTVTASGSTTANFTLSP